MVTKSSIMLGLGETDEEVKQAMADLRAVDVDILTLGQYLQVWSSSPVTYSLPLHVFPHFPSLLLVTLYTESFLILQPTERHLTVRGYVTPEKFDFWKEYGESLGFLYVASGHLVSITYTCCFSTMSS
jgi:lipoic acid synthetase